MVIFSGNKCVDYSIFLFFHFRRKAFRASLMSQQWKVLSEEVRIKRRPLDTRSIVRKQTKYHPYVPPEKKEVYMLLYEFTTERNI